MKNRPSIALAMIVKNEAHNLPGLLESVHGCFDEIHITDTGSADTTVDYLKSEKAFEAAGCPIFIHHFEWINDFSKARQYSFDQVPDHMDFIMWMDGDDVLDGKDAFIHFRDHTLHCCHMWLVKYDYAFDVNGNSMCTFVRERIVKNNYGFHWKYFVHEGIIPPNNKSVHSQPINTFKIKHIRTDVDLKQDRSRNISMFKEREDELDSRMRYYFGKELFDNGEYVKAVQVLQKLTSENDPWFSITDRVMAMQYLSMAYAQCFKWDNSLNVALLGLQLSADRGEFFNLIADALLKKQNPGGAIIFYKAAKFCSETNFNGFIHTSPIAVKEYPAVQLANIYLQIGRFHEAQKEIEYLESLNYPDVQRFKDQIVRVKYLNNLGPAEEKVLSDDIVISTPPGTVTSDWDENVLKVKGLGGSETACVEVARKLHERTKRTVKVFMQRETVDIMPSGVEYYPIHMLEEYFRRNKPYRHIAWRHTTKLTEAPTYIWSHDLVTAGGENVNNYTKYLCLSGFHKEFTKDLLGVPEHKIELVRNGIDPECFIKLQSVDKIPNKIMFSSSPDRGLERSINIVKRIREEFPDVSLHVFYGTANMRKMGNAAEADRLDHLVRIHDFVVDHGFVSKDELMKHMKESVCWLYPADFIETSCITAMEAACAHAYPLVRNMGALPYTLKEVYERGMCEILDQDCSTESEHDFWAERLGCVLREERYKKMDINIDDYSWDNAIEDFIKAMDL